MKLKAKMRVQALVRTYDLHATPCTIISSGDVDAGTIILKHATLDGYSVVYVETRTPDGAPAWRKGTGPNPVSESEADAYITRQTDIDCDAWVLEIEDPQHPLRVVEPIIE